MRSSDPVSRKELLDQVERHTWLYSVDLGDGILTKGMFGPPHTHIREVLDKIDFRGKKVLDVGCYEGHWSFEAEQRGAAEVYATDYLVGDPRAERTARGVKELPTFLLAHKIRKSNVKYYPDVSVYHVKQLGIFDFDVVLFCGVYYHLKNPVLALARLREVMKEGGIIIVEGPAVQGTREAFARFYYHDCLGNDRSNWWVPTLPCLRQWVECSFFDILDGFGPAHEFDNVIALFSEKGVATGTEDKTAVTERIARYTFLARAVLRKDTNYVFPDEDLAKFDLNQYAT